MVADRSQVEHRNLFGGAITTLIPQEYADISKFREIPDNQEVFSHGETDRSVIIELLEMQEDISTYTVPAEFHLSNIAEECGALEATTFKVLTLPTSQFATLLVDDTSLSVTAAYGRQMISKFRDADEFASQVDVYVACVRLPRATTDLLLVFNDPRELHPDGSSARGGSTVAHQDGDAPRDEVLQMALTSLRIHDWSLLE